MLNIYNIPGAELQSPMAGIARPVHEAHNSQQVIAQAGLDWAVIGKPLRTIDGQEIDSHKAMIRSDTSHCLGVVGVGYQALQNAEAFAFCDSLVETGSMTYLSAGHFGKGEKLFIQCKLNRDPVDIAPGDTIAPYFALGNAHDGSMNVRALFTPTRIICQNTFRMCFSKGANGQDSIAIRHTTNLHDRLEASKALFRLMDANFNTFTLQAKALAAKRVPSAERLKQFFDETFSVKATDAKDESTRAKNRSERLADLFMEGAGQKDKPAVRGTVWAALNAVTQFLDHEAPTKLTGIDMTSVGPDERTRLQRMNRLESNMFGAASKIKTRALELALAL